MDRNTLIALGVTVLLYFGWQWSLEKRFPDRGRTPVAPAAQPSASEPLQPAIPPPTSQGPVSTPSAVAPSAVEELVRIERPLYFATFTTRGGALREWTLKEYDDASLAGEPLVSITTEPDQASLATPFAELGWAISRACLIR